MNLISGHSLEGYALPPLVNGDRLGQAEFHRRYKACPGSARFELIGGDCLHDLAPALAARRLSRGAGLRVGSTAGRPRGRILGHDATAILGEQTEPRPDLILRILSDHGRPVPARRQGLGQRPADSSPRSPTVPAPST